MIASLVERKREKFAQGAKLEASTVLSFLRRANRSANACTTLRVCRTCSHDQWPRASTKAQT